MANVVDSPSNEISHPVKERDRKLVGFYLTKSIKKESAYFCCWSAPPTESRQLVKSKRESKKKQFTNINSLDWGLNIVTEPKSTSDLWRSASSL
jgi:hypothetical protein